MIHLLTPERQEHHLEYLAQVTLDNFSMASLLADQLIKYKNLNIPPPNVTIHLQGSAAPVTISGTNCGFFAVPIIHMAVLDCRRSLEFFGLTCDHKTKRLKTIDGRREDDLGIENFGLSEIAPLQLVSVAAEVISVPIEPILVQVHNWSNKRLAHFTISESEISLQGIRNLSIAMIESYMRFLFEPLGRPRPSLNPSLT